MVKLPENWKFGSLTPRREQIEILLASALLIWLHFYVYNWFFKMSLIGGQAYRSTSITMEGIRVWQHRLPLVWICGLLLLGSWRITWKKLALEPSIRWLVTGCALIFAWKFSSYDYNLYFDHLHFGDRLTVLLLGFAVYLHPAFLALFLSVLYPMVFQMEYPLALYSWTDKYVPLNILTLFVSFSLLCVVRRLPSAVFLFSTLCMMGAYYFYPAVGKVNIGPHWYTWMFENRLPNLIVSGWLNGWAWFISEETILRLAHYFNYLNVPSQIATIIVEGASLFLLCGVTAVVLILIGCIVMHAMIFATSGIFFWKWIAADFGMIGVVCTLTEETRKKLFHPLIALVAIPVIFFGDSYFDVVELGWLDSKANHMYEFEAVDSEGRTYTVGRDFFSPYDLTFSQNRFYNLEDGGLAADTFGSLYRYDEYIGYESDFDRQYQAKIARKRNIDPRMAAAFDTFIQKFFMNWNQRRSKATPFSFMKGPQHIYMKSRKRNYYTGEAPVKLFRVYLVHTKYDDEKITVLKEELIREIPIPETSDGASK